MVIIVGGACHHTAQLSIPSMAELPDEAVSVGSSLKKGKKAIEDVLDTENYNLSLAVSGSISTFSRLMKSKKLISVDVTPTVQSGQFEAIMHDYKAAIKLKQDLKSLEEHCSLLLEVLDELGGPATDATNVLRSNLKTEVKKKTGISFLSGIATQPDEYTTATSGDIKVRVHTCIV